MEPRPGSVGEALRRARIDRGLSVADIEAALRVRARYVEALETDDFASLPPLVYTRVLIRDYARLVGLDPTELLDRALPMRPQDRNPIRPAIRPLEKEAVISWKAVFIVAAIGLTAILFLYLYTQFESFNRGVDESFNRGVDAIEGRVPQALPTPVRGGVSSPLLTALPATLVPSTPTPEPSPTPVTGIVLEARITESSWVQVWTDSRSILAQTLPPGTTRTFSADQSIRMRVGNAGGVDVTVNGVQQGRLGGTGQALDAAWGRE